MYSIEVVLESLVPDFLTQSKFVGEDGVVRGKQSEAVDLVDYVGKGPIGDGNSVKRRSAPAQLVDHH